MPEEQILFSLPLQRMEPIFKKWVADVLMDQKKSDIPIPSKEQNLKTQQEVLDELKVSLPTLLEWRRKDLIRAHRIGRRIYYKWEDLQNALIQK